MPINVTKEISTKNQLINKINKERNTVDIISLFFCLCHMLFKLLKTSAPFSFHFLIVIVKVQ